MITQILVNSIISALLLSLVAIGFNLIFNATKVFHLAHGAMYVAAVYGYYQFNIIFSPLFSTEMAVIVSILLSFVLIIILIMVIEYFIYYPLYLKEANPTIPLISSLGVYLVGVSVIAFFFGNESIILSSKFKIVVANQWFKLTDSELLHLVIGIFVLGIVFAFTKSKYYRQIRAISDNYVGAQHFGINIKRTRLIALSIGTLLVGIAGLMKSYEVAIDPYAGMHITLVASVAVIIGGVGSIKGTVIASFVISLIENYSVLLLSAKWKEALTYVLLILVLLFYQQGLISVKQRIERK